MHLLKFKPIYLIISEITVVTYRVSTRELLFELHPKQDDLQESPSRSTGNLPGLQQFTLTMALTKCKWKQHAFLILSRQPRQHHFKLCFSSPFSIFHFPYFGHFLGQHLIHFFVRNQWKKKNSHKMKEPCRLQIC